MFQERIPPDPKGNADFFFLSLNFHALGWPRAYEICPSVPLQGILKIHQFSKNTWPGKRCLYEFPLPYLGGFLEYFNNEAV